MNIRSLGEKDSIAYRQLRLSSLKESPFAFSDSYEDVSTQSVLDFQLEIKPSAEPLESFTLGAFTNQDELIGFVKFKRDQRSKARHRAVLYALYVEPDHRGKGIAKKLILELLKNIEPLTDVEQLQLSTIISKSSLVGFYRKFGFEQLGGIIKNDLIIENQYVDALYMVKHLKRQKQHNAPFKKNMDINYKISNTEPADLQTIYKLFEDAIHYIKTNNYVGWTTYDKNFIKQDIAHKLQFKITNGGDILCIFSVCYTDALIWREREKADAVYLHRIVVNPEFKGQKQFEKILNWTKEIASERGLEYIRMDTWAANPNIIAYYKSFGFQQIEDYTTPDTAELPAQHRNLKVALLEMKL